VGKRKRECRRCWLGSGSQELREFGCERKNRDAREGEVGAGDASGGGPRGEGRRSEATVFFPSEWRRGTSSQGNPHPAAPKLENKGAGKHGPGRGTEVEGGRKAGGGGRGGRLRTFPPAAE
jgi:hypothetical protein